ncbi:MAG: RNA 2',3'-cyclic phosphodiesterase [Acidimicrobiales bacterium]
MPRLFVAVWPPADVLDRLAALARPEADGLRWTDQEQWHVTLRFLGPVDEVAPVAAALVSAAASHPPVRAVLGPAVGRFGQRILHVPVAGLDGIAEAVVRSTAHLGKPPDDRPFHGHVTLARAARDAKVDLRPLTGTAATAEWDVTSVCRHGVI